MNVTGAVIDGLTRSAQPADLEFIFQTLYPRMAKVIHRVIQDPARAEELAVEVFLNYSRKPHKPDENASAWLYRAATRKALDELRRRSRRQRRESATPPGPGIPNPEEIETARRQCEQVRLVLAKLRPRYSELLLLQSSGLAYEDLALSLRLNPASVGKLLSRARDAFRKEYVKRYGAE